MEVKVHLIYSQINLLVKMYRSLIQKLRINYFTYRIDDDFLSLCEKDFKEL